MVLFFIVKLLLYVFLPFLLSGDNWIWCSNLYLQWNWRHCFQTCQCVCAEWLSGQRCCSDCTDCGWHCRWGSHTYMYTDIVNVLLMCYPFSLHQLHLTTHLCPWTWHSTVAIQLELWWYPSLVIMWRRVPSLSLCLWWQGTVLSIWAHKPPLSPFRMMIVSIGVYEGLLLHTSCNLCT